MLDETVPLAAILEGLPTPATEIPQGLDALHIIREEAPFIQPEFREYEVESDPKVTLISARGASGKSTLAGHLSKLIQAPLWSLAHDAAVSGDAPTARLGAYLGTATPLDEAHRLPTLIIDSLDEARLRVTGLSWDQFVASLIDFSRAGVHLVLLGRKRTVEDVWVEFAERDIPVQWFEISHFDESRQKDYVDLRTLGAEAVSPGLAYEQARDLLLSHLNGQRGGDLDATFAGYAPVLDAVAALLPPGTNYLALENTFSDEGQGIKTRVGVLRQILDELLRRECEDKVARLAQDLGLPAEETFTPAEQLDWLASELLGAPAPELPWCPPEKLPQYVEQLQTFLEQHPYRHDAGWASPVFSSYVAFRRFDQVAGVELVDLASQSGLLFDFFAEDEASDGRRLITADQFTALHRSLIAGQWHTSTSAVSVRSAAVDDRPAETASVSLALVHPDSDPLTVEAVLMLEQPGEMLLASPLSNLDVEVAGVVTIVSPTASIDLGPDLYVCADSVRLTGSTVQIAKNPGGGDDWGGPSVELAARAAFEPMAELAGTPSVHELSISVPASVRMTYPWVSYRASFDEDVEGDDHNIRARRFLNKLMSLTRRDGHRGRRAVYAKKLEGRQGLQTEEFRRALEILEEVGAISVEKDMIYYSDDWESRRFDGKDRPGLPSFEDKREVWSPLLERISADLKR